MARRAKSSKLRKERRREPRAVEEWTAKGAESGRQGWDGMAAGVYSPEGWLLAFMALQTQKRIIATRKNGLGACSRSSKVSNEHPSE